jgi:hypothetical protein
LFENVQSNKYNNNNLIENQQNQQNFSMYSTNSKKKENYVFENAVLRNDKNFKEIINRLNPVDFKTYNDNDNNFNQNQNQRFKHSDNYDNNNNDFSIDKNKDNIHENLNKYNNKFEDLNNQSYFSDLNFKNTNNPFIKNNFSNTNTSKISLTKKYDNEKNLGISVVDQLIKNDNNNKNEIQADIDNKDEKIKSANYLVQEFMKDVNKVIKYLK